MLHTVASHKSHIFTLTAQAISRCVLFHTFSTENTGGFSAFHLGIPKTPPKPWVDRWYYGSWRSRPKYLGLFFGGEGETKNKTHGFFQEILEISHSRSWRSKSVRWHQLTTHHKLTDMLNPRGQFPEPTVARFGAMKRCRYQPGQSLGPRYPYARVPVGPRGASWILRRWNRNGKRRKQLGWCVKNLVTS